MRRRPQLVVGRLDAAVLINGTAERTPADAVVASTHQTKNVSDWAAGGVASNQINRAAVTDTMNYTWASATDSGHVRDHNEDSLAPTEDGSGPGPLVVAVADGMGGHVAGEVASGLAIDAAVSDAAAGLEATTRVTLGNQAVVDATRADDELAGMGTTLTLAILGTDGAMHVAHVGDSRLYLLRDDELRLLTNDHTWVGELMARGQLTPDQAAHHPRRHYLTQVLGMEEPTIDEITLDLVKRDRILVCSDGLTTMLEDARIAAHLRHEETVTGAAWALVEAANAAGGYDNTSVVVIDVGP